MVGWNELNRDDPVGEPNGLRRTDRLLLATPDGSFVGCVPQPVPPKPSLRRTPTCHRRCDDLSIIEVRPYDSGGGPDRIDRIAEVPTGE